MANILLLEDDDTLAETLTELLESDAYEVTWVKNGEDAFEATFNTAFELFLLDVNVPLVNGFEFLKSLRDAHCDTPAIYITAMRDIASIAEGFEIGADDYIKKPFEYDELSIRIKSLIRKSHKINSKLLHVKGFSYKTESDELYKGETYIPLSRIELKLTRLLFLHIDTTLSKEEILYTLSDGGESSEGALRVHITALRKVGLNIHNIKGIGYRLVST